jgi:hypothetical protein
MPAVDIDVDELSEYSNDDAAQMDPGTTSNTSEVMLGCSEEKNLPQQQKSRKSRSIFTV